MSDVGDIIDRANDQAQRILDASISAQRAARVALRCTERCHNCGERIKAERKFCDAACRDDWQARHPNQ